MGWRWCWTSDGTSVPARCVIRCMPRCRLRIQIQTCVRLECEIAPANPALGVVVVPLVRDALAGAAHGVAVCARAWLVGLVGGRVVTVIITGCRSR